MSVRGWVTAVISPHWNAIDKKGKVNYQEHDSLDYQTCAFVYISNLHFLSQLTVSILKSIRIGSNEQKGLFCLARLCNSLASMTSACTTALTNRSRGRSELQILNFRF